RIGFPQIEAIQSVARGVLIRSRFLGPWCGWNAGTLAGVSNLARKKREAESREMRSTFERGYRRRRLQFEALESRWVMSATTVVVDQVVTPNLDIFSPLAVSS